MSSASNFLHEYCREQCSQSKMSNGLDGSYRASEILDFWSKKMPETGHYDCRKNEKNLIIKTLEINCRHRF